MQERGKLDFKKNVTPNGFKKYMSSSIIDKLIIIDSF